MNDPSEAMWEATDVHLRRISSHREYEACVALQYATWGEAFTECAPPSLLMISQKIGGITAGAFDERDRLVGFVFSLPGFLEGRRMQWSDLLAVEKGHRNRGIGRALKWFQRSEALRTGFPFVYWTFDPLAATNAALNIGTLGARPISYVPDMYSSSNRSTLHAGLSMDRFVVRWDLKSAEVWDRAQGLRVPTEPSAHMPILLRLDPETMAPVESGATNSESVGIEIPADLQKLKAEQPHVALAWREITRRLFVRLFDAGYQIIDFRRQPVSHYVLRKG